MCTSSRTETGRALLYSPSLPVRLPLGEGVHHTEKRPYSLSLCTGTRFLKNPSRSHPETTLCPLKLTLQSTVAAPTQLWLEKRLHMSPFWRY